MPWAQHATAARNATKRSMEGTAVRRLMDFDGFCNFANHFFHCRLFSANLFQRIYYCSLGWSDALMQWHVHRHAACNLCEKDTYFNLVLWNFQRPILQRETSKNDCLNCGWNHPTTASKQAFNLFCFGFGASHVLDVSEAVCCREPQPRWGELNWFFGSGLRLTRLTLGRGTRFFHLDLSRSPAVPTIDLPNWESYESYDLSPSQQVSEFLLQKLDAYEIQNNLTCKLHYQ